MKVLPKRTVPKLLDLIMFTVDDIVGAFFTIGLITIYSIVVGVCVWCMLSLVQYWGLY